MIRLGDKRLLLIMKFLAVRHSTERIHATSIWVNVPINEVIWSIVRTTHHHNWQGSVFTLVIVRTKHWNFSRLPYNWWHCCICPHTSVGTTASWGWTAVQHHVSSSTYKSKPWPLSIVVIHVSCITVKTSWWYYVGSSMYISPVICKTNCWLTFWWWIRAFCCWFTTISSNWKQQLEKDD